MYEFLGVYCSIVYIQVSRDTSRNETVCDCENPGPGKTLTVGSTFYVPPNNIDFRSVFVDTDPLGNASVLGTVIAVFVAFVLFVPWAWRADLKDKYKVKPCQKEFILK